MERRVLLRREERRTFHTIFKELAFENKHAQFVARVEQISKYEIPRPALYLRARDSETLV